MLRWKNIYKTIYYMHYILLCLNQSQVIILCIWVCWGMFLIRRWVGPRALALKTGACALSSSPPASPLAPLRWVNTYIFYKNSVKLHTNTEANAVVYVMQVHATPTCRSSWKRWRVKPSHSRWVSVCSECVCEHRQHCTSDDHTLGIITDECSSDRS